MTNKLQGEFIGCAGSPLSAQDRSVLRREHIINIARKLFMKNGFHATGVAELAKRSGIGVGQIYRDFESKEEIVAAIVEQDCARFLAPDSLRQALAVGNSQAVWRWIEDLIYSGDRAETGPMFAQIVAESVRNERIAAIFTQTRGVIYNSMLAALALLVPGEQFVKQREALADLVLTQSLGLSQHALLHPSLDTGRLSKQILAFIRHELESMVPTPSVG